MTMQFSVTGKQVDVGEALSRHIEDSLNGPVEKYFGHGIVAHAVVSREAHRYCVDVSVHIGRNILVQAQEKANDPYLAADKAAEHIAKRLRRHKRRLKDHHANGSAQRNEKAFYQILAAEAYADGMEVMDGAADNGMMDGVTLNGHDIDLAEGPVVVAEMTTEIPTLTVGEAVMRLDLANIPALMFRSSCHGGLNVVYRRADGNIGWIDPREPAASTAGMRAEAGKTAH
jgi:ribosomal subunit interface protein